MNDVSKYENRTSYILQLCVKDVQNMTTGAVFVIYSDYLHSMDIFKFCVNDVPRVTTGAVFIVYYNNLY